MNLNIKVNNIPKYWVLAIVFVYGLLMSQYLDIVTKAVSPMSNRFINSTMYDYIVTFNIINVILSAFAVWILSTFLFHMFSILLGGEADFKSFIKYSGIIYIFPSIGFAICLILFESIELPKDDIEAFFESNSILVSISWIINISSSLCFILLIPIIKYLYKLNWIKAIGALAIPLGSIFLLGQFFSNYVL